MTRWVLLAAFAAMAHAQLALSIVDGTTETPLSQNSIYQMHTVEPGTTSSILVRVRNTGTSNADITLFSASGTGFSFNRPLPPQTLAPGGILNGTLTFTAGDPANYNATVKMNSITASVLINVIRGAVLDAGSPCSRALNGDTISFGTPFVGDRVSCEITLRNPTSQTIIVNTLNASGTGYCLGPVATPLTLSPGAAFVFTLQLEVLGGGSLAGVFSVNARQYVLTAIGVDPPIPQPILDWESSAVMSAQQRKLSMRLAEPSRATATGFLDLSFQSNVNAVGDDPAVLFLEAGVRRVSYRIEKGKAEVTLNGLPFVTFQTGTTAGVIRFALTEPRQGFTQNQSFAIAIPPAPLAFDQVIATRLPTALQFLVAGFDNTYSIGPMLFRFYDANGQQITAGIPADFTQSFRDYFTAGQSGSAFKAGVKFDVRGDTSGIAAMEAEISSAAGTYKTGRLTF